MNYQERVVTRADVRALYEKVIANPVIKKYRGYTQRNSYGWDPAAEDYVKKEGEAWFDNPAYDPTCAAPIMPDNVDITIPRDIDPTSAKANDRIAHPSHYTQGKIECIDFILDKQLDFPLGNAIKYIVRAGHKSEEGMTDREKAIEDLNKAIQYIKFEIEHLEDKR